MSSICTLISEGIVHCRKSWAPLTVPLFRRIWLATFLSNIGTWMHEIASAWLMTSLTTSPLLIALMQTASYLPIMLIGIPAGAIADLHDRRQIVIWGQSWMLVATACLGVLTMGGLVTPWILLALTLLMGMGAAFTVPALGVLTQDLVEPDQIQAAVAINSSGRHLARGIGSAIGGVALALTGPGQVFMVNAASFAVILIILWLWCRRSPAQRGKRDGQFGRAIREGFAYTRQSKSLLITNAIALVFGVSSSALWALLPLFVRQSLAMSSFEYGLTMSAFAFGSIAGVTALAWLRRLLSMSGATLSGLALMAFSVMGLSFSRENLGVYASMCLAGLAWIIVVSALNAYVLWESENSTRSRTLAIFATIWQASLAIGSLLWGLLASATTCRVALLASAAAMCATAIIFARYQPIGRANELFG